MTEIVKTSKGKTRETENIKRRKEEEIRKRGRGYKGK